jgi:hypothetical protein
MVRVLVLVALSGMAQGLPATPKTVLGLDQMGSASSAVGPEPKFTEKAMPAVSPALQCVMSLGIQYFLIYTCLAIVRTANEFDGFAFIGVQKILETACTTVTYAPMLSVLFLGARMRAIQLTQGETEKYKLPQPWVQMAMFSTVYAVLAQVILVLIIPVFTGEMSQTTDEHGDIDMSKVQIGGMGATILSVVRYIIMLALYGGFTVVIVGVFMMEGPKEIWGNSVPPVSPAVLSTMLLTATFFLVYLLVALSKTAVEVSGTSPFLEKLVGLLTLARYTVNFAPMLAILFIGARMRALQIDPKHGNPQRWAQMCFYACTASVVVQTLTVLIMPFCVQCECKQGVSEGDVVFEMEHPTVAIVFTVVRYLALLALYGGFSAVIVSVFLISHPTDVSLTPPISPAMQCVMNLTLQYFTIYLVLFVSITVQQFTELEALHKVIAIFEGAQKTVMFAPMLSILFVGTRMRALQLTIAKDGTIPPSAGPQPWVQDAMFLATWSVLVQLVMCILVPLCTGTATPETDHSGNVKVPEGSHKYLGIAVETIRYLSLVAMYGGIVTVMVGIYMMTPENLPPYSHDGTLIPGAEVPQPPTPPTKAEAQ